MALVSGSLAFVGLAVALVPGTIEPLVLSGVMRAPFESRFLNSRNEFASTPRPADGVVSAPLDSPPPAAAPEPTQPHLVRSFFFQQKDDLPAPLEEPTAPPAPAPVAPPTATIMEVPPPPPADILPITPPDATGAAQVTPAPEPAPSTAESDAGVR